MTLIFGPSTFRHAKCFLEVLLVTILLVDQVSCSNDLRFNPLVPGAY